MRLPNLQQFGGVREILTPNFFLSALIFFSVFKRSFKKQEFAHKEGQRRVMANHKSRLLDYIILLLCPLLISAQFWSVSFGGCTFYPDPSGALLRVGECPTENYYGNGLDLSSKGITSLPSDIFRGMAAVTIIRLNNNKIQVLPAGIFRDARSLTAVYLNDNSLILLAADVFQGLNSLESLDLCKNNISTLPEIIFKDPGFTLSSLKLYSNNITSLPEGIFQGFVTITNLDLHDNRLRTLPEGIFRGLRRLSSLSLYDNQITALPVGVFQGLPSLRSLEICGPLAGGTSPVLSADGKTVIYKGYGYKTLDETSPNSGPYSYNNRGCQTSYIALPSGWSVADENEDSKRVIGAFSWGTYCLAVANGNSYATSFGISHVWGRQANCGSGVMFTSGVSYVISDCNYPRRILISRTLRANCTIPCIPLTSEQVAGMGDSYNGPSTLCVICPKNSQAPQNSTTSNDCVCSTGYSGPGGAAGVCLACASGKYKGFTGTAACKDCDVGMYSGVESASACSLCPLGHYSNLEGAATCRLCATPTFTSVLGSTCAPPPHPYERALARSLSI